MINSLAKIREMELGRRNWGIEKCKMNWGKVFKEMIYYKVEGGGVKFAF
jgi:hypothetical protein